MSKEIEIIESGRIDGVLSVTFDAVFEGNGCVNFDSGDQIKVLQNMKLLNSDYNKENLAPSKKIFEKTEDGYAFRHMVSADCIKHDVFSDCSFSKNPLVGGSQELLAYSVADKRMLVKGYQYSSRGKNTVSRKSCVTITNAIEDSEFPNTRAVFSFNCTDKPKMTNEDKEGSKDNSIHKTEVVGKLSYKSSGCFFDFTEGQFIPADLFSQRLCYHPEMAGVVIQRLEEQFPDMRGLKQGYRYKKNQSTGVMMAECGLMLSQAAVDEMFKDFMKNLMNLNINRRSSTFKFKEFSGRIIVNTTSGKKEIIINDVDDLNNYGFFYDEQYLVADADVVLNTQKKMLEYLDYNRELAKQAKKEEQDRKKSKKNKQTEDNE